MIADMGETPRSWSERALESHFPLFMPVITGKKWPKRLLGMRKQLLNL